MRTRIKTRVVVSDAITEMETRSQKKREFIATIIKPMAVKYMEMGSTYAQAIQFAHKQWQIQTSLNYTQL